MIKIEGFQVEVDKTWEIAPVPDVMEFLAEVEADAEHVGASVDTP